jgi:prepilin-type processing-associated H-X9-DG protein
VSGLDRNFRSHFGFQQTVPGGFRFNVVHLDGHVDSSLWKEPWVSTEWMRSDPSYDNRPYGWAYKGAPNDTSGLMDEPEWKGAFDTNM